MLLLGSSLLTALLIARGRAGLVVPHDGHVCRGGRAAVAPAREAVAGSADVLAQPSGISREGGENSARVRADHPRL